QRLHQTGSGVPFQKTGRVLAGVAVPILGNRAVLTNGLLRLVQAVAAFSGDASQRQPRSIADVIFLHEGRPQRPAGRLQMGRRLRRDWFLGEAAQRHLKSSFAKLLFALAVPAPIACQQFSSPPARALPVDLLDVRFSLSDSLLILR